MMACRLGRNMQHFLIYHKQIVMLEGIKYEIYVEMRQYNGMIFNKIFKNNFLNEWTRDCQNLLEQNLC